MRYHVHSKNKEKRHRSGRQFGATPVEIDTENMAQEEIDAILNDTCLICVPEAVPEVPKAEIDEVSHELLDEILTEDESEVVSEAEITPEPEEVEVQKDEVETKAKAKKPRAKSAPPQEQAE